ITQWELGFYLNETAEAGQIVVGLTASSGADLDGTDAEVEIAVEPSGKKPVGVLLDDFVDIDLSRYQLNHHKPEQQVGGKASIARRGWVVTDQVYTGQTPVAFGHAVLGPSGTVMPPPASWNVTHVNYP